MINGHGDDLYRYPRVWANFSSNVYGATDNSELIAYLKERMPDVIGSYPEPEPYTLQGELAESLGCLYGEVMVTNGATEAIYLLAQLKRQACTHILEPTFSEYRDACTLMGHRLIDKVESYEELDSVWLCNPNNPTGLIFNESGLEVEKYTDTLFVIDRSYEYFSREPLQPELKRDNVVYIHSLTKRYRIPGLRLGYITGTEQTLNLVRALRQPWSVNALAIEAGRWIINQGFPETIDRDRLWAETDRLSFALRRIRGVKVCKTDTHFMVIELPILSSDAKEFLAREHGLLLRDASNFRGLSDRHIRIATQNPEANNALISALGTLLTP